MCLDTRFKPEVEKKMIAKLPVGLITVYKVVSKDDGHYSTDIRGIRYRVGLNHANTNHRLGGRNHEYDSGYHSFVTMHGAYKWSGSVYLKMQIRKEWITAIGRQAGCIVYVTDRIISPSLRDKSAVVE